MEKTTRVLSVPTLLNNKYLLQDVIGNGGYAITYKAYDSKLEIPVAIKEFCPREYAGRNPEDGRTVLPFNREALDRFQQEREKFLREAQMLAKFRRTYGVVPVIDYFKENNTAYIVMEYVPGVTLKDYMKSLGEPMKYYDFLDMFNQLFYTIEELHEAGVIHRDISPDNIMIGENEEDVFLIDFGSAIAINEENPAGYKKGFYTPPEQCEGGKQGTYTDIYALCATAYQCVTGRGIPTAKERVEGSHITTLEDMGLMQDADFEEGIYLGLEMDPEKRIQTIDELMHYFYEMED